MSNREDRLTIEIEGLQAEIDELQEELNSIHSGRGAVRPLGSYSEKEKVAHFNCFYESALEHLGSVEENGEIDGTQHMFELVMNLLSSEDKEDDTIWDYYNSLI